MAIHDLLCSRMEHGKKNQCPGFVSVVSGLWWLSSWYNFVPTFTSYNLLKPLSIIRLLPLDPLQEGSSEGGMVGGINNCDLTGIMCRPGSLIMIASGSIDIISQYYVNTL